MDLKDLGNLISKSAPLLGGAISIVNPFAGMLINSVSQLFGADRNNAQDIIQKIQADPEAHIKLAALEFQHQEELLKIKSQNYQTEVDDRKSARNREIELHDHVPMILAITFVLIYAVVQAYCIHAPSTSNDLISARVQDIMMMIIGFYFGSSVTKWK